MRVLPKVVDIRGEKNTIDNSKRRLEMAWTVVFPRRDVLYREETLHIDCLLVFLGVFTIACENRKLIRSRECFEEVNTCNALGVGPLSSSTLTPFLKSMKVGTARMLTSCAMSYRMGCSNEQLICKAWDLEILKAYCLLIDIHLVEFNFSDLLGQFLKGWTYGLAGTTPYRPEIEDGVLVLRDLISINASSSRQMK